MKIIKTAKYIEKASQFEYDEGDDLTNWEEEQVFQDQAIERQDENFEDEEYLSIEPQFTGGRPDGYVLVEHGVYPDSSVLAGQPRRSSLDFADTAEELKERHPEAEVLDRSSKVDRAMPSGPPEGFDEADAGERWGEDY